MAHPLLLSLTACLLSSAAARRPPATQEQLLAMIATPRGRPVHVTDAAFDCAWRPLALQYASDIQPWLTPSQLQAINDSLQLCPNATSVATMHLPRASPVLPIPLPRAADCASALCVYVDPVNGNDGGSGTISSPLRTIPAALNATRKNSATGGSIILRGGTYYINATIQLTPADSGLTIAAYAGETPVISGGTPIALGAWTAYNVVKNATWGPVLVNQNAVFGQCGGSPGVPNMGVMPSWQACQAACVSNATCTAWTWNGNGPNISPSFQNVCCFRTDGQFSPVQENSTWSQGSSPAQNVWVADVTSAAVTSMPSLQRAGARVTLARYPNANPELDLFPAGYITIGGVWLPPADEGTPYTYTVVLDPAEADGGAGIYINYTVGLGGAASRYTPPRSFWASADFGPQAYQPTHVDDRWQEMHLRSPSGLDFNGSLPHAPYAQGAGAIVHTWRLGHWYSWMFQLGPQLSPTSYNFSAGGHQGGEGCDTAAEWWVEGVMEELDAPNEYYYDAAAGKLYLFYNATPGTPPTPSDAFVVPTLDVLFNIGGSAEYPVVNVTLSGLTMTAAAPTFMAPHGVPSGGDWALERLGAVLLEGAVGVSISNCTFTRLDGNAIMLSGYNRNVSITRNVFEWLGASAIASWGYSDEYDGTGGQQPWYTYIVGNLAYEIGIQQKQSSFYFQAVSALNIVKGNIVYNIPRAAINLDDNFGGGTEISANLLYNTCRESSDHGAINSWSRMPYVTMVRDGVTRSAIPAVTTIARNFIVANYAADGGCHDADDGSSYYLLDSNFCVYGGHKSDFDGHAKTSVNNLHVYPSVYGPTCMNVGAQLLPAPGFNEVYVNNTCILEAGQNMLRLDNRGIPAPANFTITLGGNTIYAPNSSVMVQYSQSVTFQAFQAAGYDIGSVVNGSVPDPATIVAWGAQLLAGGSLPHSRA